MNRLKNTYTATLTPMGGTAVTIEGNEAMVAVASVRAKKDVEANGCVYPYLSIESFCYSVSQSSEEYTDDNCESDEPTSGLDVRVMSAVAHEGASIVGIGVFGGSGNYKMEYSYTSSDGSADGDVSRDFGEIEYEGETIHAYEVGVAFNTAETITTKITVTDLDTGAVGTVEATVKATDVGGVHAEWLEVEFDEYVSLSLWANTTDYEISYTIDTDITGKIRYQYEETEYEGESGTGFNWNAFNPDGTYLTVTVILTDNTTGQKIITKKTATK